MRVERVIFFCTARKGRLYIFKVGRTIATNCIERSETLQNDATVCSEKFCKLDCASCCPAQRRP